MLEYMENISQSEAENIRKTIQDLFRQTCILQTKCDPVTLIQKDNPHYQVCARNREFIVDYLQVLDCELVHDPQEHIFRITGDGVLTERMTLLILHQYAPFPPVSYHPFPPATKTAVFPDLLQTESSVHP